MKKTISLLILILPLFPTFSSAQSLSDIPGSFVDIGFGTRPVAMGFAFVGLADDENSPYWNPSGLGYIDEIKAGFSQIDHLQLCNSNRAAAREKTCSRNFSDFIW